MAIAYQSQTHLPGDVHPVLRRRAAAPGPSSGKCRGSVPLPKLFPSLGNILYTSSFTHPEPHLTTQPQTVLIQNKSSSDDRPPPSPRKEYPPLPPPPPQKQSNYFGEKCDSNHTSLKDPHQFPNWGQGMEEPWPVKEGSLGYTDPKWSICSTQGSSQCLLAVGLGDQEAASEWCFLPV